LYPNPSFEYSKLIIDLASSSDVDIKIIDAEGKLIKSMIIPESNGKRTLEEVEISGLPSGVYMIHIAQNEFKTVKKLIVVK
jgi:hypothetical protein